MPLDSISDHLHALVRVEGAGSRVQGLSLSRVLALGLNVEGLGWRICE